MRNWLVKIRPSSWRRSRKRVCAAQPDGAIGMETVLTGETAEDVETAGTVAAGTAGKRRH